jgi:DNA-binding Xre family transcriptional regulator
MAKKARKQVRRATRGKPVRVRTRVQLNKLIGQRVREERVRKNIKLRELSDSVGLTTSQLSQVELGKNAASVWALVRIANSLGVRVSTFLADV